MTKTGVFMGTIQYASPEQVDGQRVDKRSDIFSTGVLMAVYGGKFAAQAIDEALQVEGMLPSRSESIYATLKDTIMVLLYELTSRVLQRKATLTTASATGFGHQHTWRIRNHMDHSEVTTLGNNRGEPTCFSGGSTSQESTLYC
jgi:serine/threonine protein kinase